MSDATHRFFAAWGMDDASDRNAAITAALSPDATYADPRQDSPLTGPDAIADYVAMFGQAAPGAVAEVTNAEARDGVTRATVAFRMPNGMEQLGQYFIEHDNDGRISRMVGFKGTGTSQ